MRDGVFPSSLGGLGLGPVHSTALGPQFRAQKNAWCPSKALPEVCGLQYQGDSFPCLSLALCQHV